MADPHALVLNDTCYLFTGHDTGFGVPDWIMPDWRIFRSNDLRSWKQVGTISPAGNYMGAGNTNCWAGDCVHRKGRFYWFFSNRNRETGVMVADAPEGPYHDALGGPLVDSFDPTVFIDHDNTPYLVYGYGDYRIAPLTDDLLALADEPRALPLDRKEVFPVMDKNSLHWHNGLYYLSCSGFYATSPSLFGPYQYRGVVGTGWQLDSAYAHGDFFIWRDQWYHVWCRYRDRTVDRVRDCFIAPVVYGDDGRMWDDLSDLPAQTGGHF